MGTRSGITEVVAVSPLRWTIFLATALLGMLIIFGVSGDTAFARGKPTAFSGTGFVLGIDGGDVTNAGNSDRFVVKERSVNGFVDPPPLAAGPLFGAFSATFGTNVPILSQSGNIHGDLSLGGDGAGNFAFGASFVAKSKITSLSGTIPSEGTFVGFEQFLPDGMPVGAPVFGHIAALKIDGKMTFTSGAQGHGTVDGIFWVIVDPLTGHITGGAIPQQEFTNVLTGFPEESGLSTISMDGTWHQ